MVLLALFFSSLTFSLREFSRTRLEAWLKRHGKEHYFERTIEHAEELAFITATLRLLCNITILLGVLALFKFSPRLSRLGSIPMAILVGVGAAVAIGGAVFGTLFGQIGGTFAQFNVRQGGNLLSAVYVLAGAVCTLAYFQFSARGRSTVSPTLAWSISR